MCLVIGNVIKEVTVATRRLLSSKVVLQLECSSILQFCYRARMFCFENIFIYSELTK